MDRFFSGQIHGRPFAMFSASHLAALFAVVLVNVLCVVWFRRHRDGKAVQSFRYWLAGVIFVNELLYNLWSIVSGVWSADVFLPIQLCDAVTFLSVAALIWENRLCFELVYFLGLGGSLQALLTPDLAYPFPHFVFINFFLSHGAILTTAFYMIAARGFKPEARSIVRVFIATNLYMIPVAVINLLTDGNYMFICRKPESASLIDLLGPWPWYVASLEGVGLLICLLFYLPFFFLGLFGKARPGRIRIPPGKTPMAG